jgi:hypothetical protein
VTVVFLLAAGCSELKPNRCDQASDCGDPKLFTCDANKRCVANGGGTSGHGGAGGAGGAGGVGGVAGVGGVPGHDAGMDGPAPCSVDAHSCGDPNPICDQKTRACRGCESNGECMGVDSTRSVCLISSAGDAGSVSDAGHGRDAGDGGHATAATGVCVECIDSTTCGGNTRACDLTTHSCVQCVADTDCPYTAPVCDLQTKKCGPCTGDSDCARFAPAAPGVCKTTFPPTDGATPPARCATSSDVVVVDENSGCSDAGTSSTFCTLSSAVAALTPARNIMIIAGGTSDRLTLATTNVAPVVIGRKNAGGDPGSIPATTGTAVTVSSDTVTIRDLAVNLGSSANSRGIAISGATTVATVLRVTANLTTGLGIDVENGASALIDQSYVQNNSVGGILVNGANATIQNSIITDNPGYGVQFNNAGTKSQFWFNTVVNNGVAAVCNLNAPIVLQDSILVGSIANCMSPMNSVTTMPTFASSPPYHLTAHKPCPTTAMTSSPGHDIDGDPRGTTPDCGADQFTGK